MNRSSNGILYLTGAPIKAFLDLNGDAPIYFQSTECRQSAGMGRKQSLAERKRLGSKGALMVSRSWFALEHQVLSEYTPH